MSEEKTDTIIEKVAVEDLDNLLGMPGADSVMLPSEEDSKPKFFQKEQVDLSFIDEDDDKTEVNDDLNEDDKTPDEPVKTESFEKIVNEVQEEDIQSEEDVKSNVGRPALDKEGMKQLVSELTKEGLITPFEGEENFDNYSLNDYKELFNENFRQKAGEFDQKAMYNLMGSLPQELQMAAKYVHDGGSDLKGLFSALAQSEATKELSTDSERGQEYITKNYLEATNFGDSSDIQEQIEEWKDLGKLQEKAEKFKPKLDKMQEKIVHAQLARQEEEKRQQEEHSQLYMESVYKTLQPAELNGIKLNSKIQNLLYSGLVQPNYPSISGKPTNLFGHLIEKYQFVEPNHGLIAEALWLLADPDGYKSEISKTVKNEHVSDTVRKLKTEQANKNASTETNIKNKNKREYKALQRPSKGFFKR